MSKPNESDAPTATVPIGSRPPEEDLGSEMLPQAFREAGQNANEGEAVDPEGDNVPGTGPLWHRLAGLRTSKDGPAQRTLGITILAVALALGIFQIYIIVTHAMDARQQRLVHLMLVLAFGFIVAPASKKAWAKGKTMFVVDLVFIAATVAVCVYPILYQAQLARRAGAYETLDWIMGLTLCIVLLEITRRTVGLFMSLLVLAFMFYAWAGPWFPGDFRHRGATIERISTHVYLGTDGILGFTLGVVVTFVFIFILFGALLQKSGGGNFFIGIAFALTGKSPGGPAKGAVVGSALMGSVSGSAISNVATTGPFTIPMMKKVGYKSADAAGIEAAASTGGQILPPIMGAGAFLIAERTGIPYAEIVKVSIIPALMYFASVYVFVSLLARKHKIGGMSEEQLPKVKDVMKQGWHFLAPLVLLITLLLNYMPPARAGMWAIAALFVVAMLRTASRMSFKDILEVFVIAAKNTLPVTAACAIAGVIVGIVGMTGLGLVVSELLITAFQGSLILTLIMVALASLILGVGLPVTASYVVIIILAGPALEQLGLAVIVTHLIVYWLSQDSNVTPPVALAAFVGAGIAGAKPMRSALSAWKFAKGLYLIPLLMAYSALLLNGTWQQVVIAVITGMVALIAGAIALEGFTRSKVQWYWRIALAITATFIFIAPEWNGWFSAVSTDIWLWGGTALSILLVAYLYLRSSSRNADKILPPPTVAAATPAAA